MKVIKHGNLPEKKKCEWTCKNCHAIVEAYMHEGVRFGDQRNSDAIIFRCPDCQVKNYINEELFE